MFCCSIFRNYFNDQNQSFGHLVQRKVIEQLYYNNILNYNIIIIEWKRTRASFATDRLFNMFLFIIYCKCNGRGIQYYKYNIMVNVKYFLFNLSIVCQLRMFHTEYEYVRHKYERYYSQSFQKHCDTRCQNMINNTYNNENQ